MAKWHIGSDGQPHICKAMGGRCPFGGADGTYHHYNSLAEANKVAEEIASRLYAKRTLNTSMIRYKLSRNKLYPDEAVPQSELNGRITDRDLEEVLERYHRYVVFDGEIDSHPVVSMRTSPAMKERLEQVRSEYYSTKSNRNKLCADGEYGAALSTAMQSLKNVQANLDILKQKMKDQSADGVEGACVAGVYYDTSPNKDINFRGVMLDNVITFDTNLIRDDLGCDYALDDVMDHEGEVSARKLYDAMVERNGYQSAHDSGLFEYRVTWYPDSQDIQRIADGHQSSVMSVGSVADDIGTPAQMRAMYCELYDCKAGLYDEIRDIQRNIKVQSEEEQGDPMAWVQNPGSSRSAMNGLRFKSRRVLQFRDPDPAKVREEIRAMGFDDARFDKYKRVTPRSLHKFRAKHPEANLGYWRYAQATPVLRYKDETKDITPPEQVFSRIDPV